MKCDDAVPKSIICMQLLALIAVPSVGCSREEPPTQPWTLRDSSPVAPTNFDPIKITDAYTTTLAANVYEGLVRLDVDGKIVPGLAESWQVDENGLRWTFKLRPTIHHHSPEGEADRPITSDDVVYSFGRTITDRSSLYSWLFVDLIIGAKEARERGPGTSVEGIRSIGRTTVEVKLLRQFPLLDRLVMAGAWIYPQAIVMKEGDGVFQKRSIGTGPYALVQYIQDDRVELRAFEKYWGGFEPTSPASVVVRIISDPLASIEAFRRAEIDVVQIELETVAAAQSIERAGKAKIHSVTSNSLDYLVMNLRMTPFDDLRVRRAVNLAIDRDALVSVLSGMAVPARGFLPPCSRSFRGSDELQRIGFRHDLNEATRLVAEYLQQTQQRQLDLKFVVDSGELPETIAVFVRDQLQKIPGVNVSLVKQTWPEVLQGAFAGSLPFFRFWWNVVTPGEDVYFLFYRPGSEPPTGFNFSFYGSKTFESTFDRAFQTTNFATAVPSVRNLEEMLIADAVAVPLIHRRFSFLMSKGLEFPINQLLARPYREARK